MATRPSTIESRSDFTAVLTQEALAEFEQLWKADHPGQKPNRKQLAAEAQRVLNAVQLTYRPIPAEREEELKRLEN